MKYAVFFAGPRKAGNTARMTQAFLEESRELGAEVDYVSLYEKDLRPCLGCMVCQDRLDCVGCVQKDDLEEIFRVVRESDVLVLASPIYAWYCTAPMKNFMDRVIYAGNKNYGKVRGDAFLRGKHVAAIATCGYPVERGVDVWEEGLKRWSKHGKMHFHGIVGGRDFGFRAPEQMDIEKEARAREFARQLYAAVTESQE